MNKNQRTLDWQKDYKIFQLSYYDDSGYEYVDASKRKDYNIYRLVVYSLTFEFLKNDYWN